MDSTEAAKLKTLLAELDRLCADATKIREQISELTHQRPIWPATGDRAQRFPQHGDVHNFATRPEPERRN